MTVVRELLTVLGFDLNETGFKRAEKGFKSLIGLSAEIVERVFRVGEKLVDITLQAADAGDEALAASRRTGLGVEQYQQFAFAAEQANASTSDLETGIKSLAKTAEQAARKGGDAGRAFNRLGVRVADANGKVRPTGELFVDVLDALSKVENPTERLALAQQTLGRSSQSLLPLIAEGRDGFEAMTKRASELGDILDEKTARAGDELNDSVNEMNRAVGGVTRRLGAGLIPTVLRLTRAVTDLVLENRELIDRGLVVIIDLVDTGVRGLEAFARKVSNNARAIAIFGGVLTLLAIPALVRLAAAHLAAAASAAAHLAIPALIAAAYLALALIIAAVIEDVYVFVTGGESLLGSLFDAFLNAPADPNEHWMITALRAVLGFVRDAIKATDDFFKGFFDDAERMGGVWEALKNAGGTAIDFWIKKLKEFIFDWDSSPLKKGLDFLTSPVQTVTGIATQRAQAAVIEQGAGVLQRVTQPSRFEPGRVPLASGGGTTVLEDNRRQEINVNLAGVTDPLKIHEILSKAISDALAEDRREVARALEGRQVR